ncbi:TRAP transporter small permease [Pollutimonas thiosulfatoxidans]|uniref:TRAP transporter small permease protein n=1 Tax=Pollutimonas thiosulfatoxidans TaxID=2028345 RepID=A0A451FSW8_9BURK|nr:TRAP transporter small permease [Pollutimonas thiosulfatoxidans]QAA95640.1 TRAP transporter permease DctQ [Pollutimonas thiosulfatoxidans]
MSSQQEPVDEIVEPILPEIVDPPVRVPLKVEDWISVLVLAGLALITFINVIVRYMTDGSFAWTEEISVFLLIILTMTAGATAFVRNQHIRIEVYADGGPPQRRRRLAIIGNSIVLLFFVLLTILSGRMVFDDYTWGDTSPAIGVPNWWYTVWMPVLAGAITLRVAGILRRLLRDGK